MAICGIDIDLNLKELQKKLDGAKTEALAAVTAGIEDVKNGLKSKADDLKNSFISMLPDLPDPKEYIKSLDGDLAELGTNIAKLQAGNISQELKDGLNKKIASIKKDLKKDWGEGLDKAGVDLDAIIEAFEGGDPCAIIPNLQKGEDGIADLLPTAGKFPIDGALGELKSEISEAATVAKGKLTEFGADVDAGVGAIATQVKNATDDATIKLARAGKAPASKRAPMEKPEKPELLTVTLDELRARYPRPESMDVSEYESEMMTMYREKKGLAKMINKNAEDRYNVAIALWEKQQPLIT